MIEEVLPDLYTIEVPLPRNPLRALNSYVIKGDGRFLVIDTGMNRDECRQAMTEGLRQIGVDLERTDFFITHLHADHIGLVSTLARPSSRISFNKPDATVIRADNQWQKNSRFALMNGFPEDELNTALANHPGRIYSARRDTDFHLTADGDAVNIGDYMFRCVVTPGHTRGHTCLYEPNRKILLSGDHILVDITPNISLWGDDENPLKQYLASLEKVNQLDIDLVLPGHRERFRDCRARIAELKKHHETRANEVLGLVANAPGRNAFDIASNMTWDMDYKQWSDFPPNQKWFAFGEAVSHLKYLQDNGKVIKQTRDTGAVYTAR